MENTIAARSHGYEFTDAELHVFFDRVKNREHWKNPVSAVVALDSERDIVGVTDAIIYFTGSVPDISRVGTLHHVSAAGYFETIGA